MSANWQPPFGLPFPMPLPPQVQNPHQQQQQQDGQGAPSDQYRAPTPDAYANPWNLPGLNLQAYGQNAQQPQYPQAAPTWPPPTPTPEMWNQMHMYPFMMQPGAMPPMPGMPPMPPMPGMHFPPAPNPHTPVPHTPHPPFQHLAPPAQYPPPTPQPTQPFQPVQPTQHATPLPKAAANDRRSEIVDSDKEDGEVSEGDQPAHSLAGHDQRHPQPPRSVPQSKPTSVQMPAKASANNPAPKMPTPQAQPAKELPEASDPINSIAHQREEVKKFVRLLHQHGYNYRALADENLDASHLRDLYRSLNLPSEPEPVPPPKPVTAVPATAAVAEVGPSHTKAPATNGTKPTPSVKTNVKAITKPAPSPVDRVDYLAQLRSRVGKLKSTPMQKTPPTTKPPIVNTPEPTAAAATEAKEKARQTEVIRQRMEALKKTSSSPVAPAGPRLPAAQNTPTAALSSAQVQTSSPRTNTQVSPSAPSSSFTGIPGLFMNSQSAPQAPSTPFQAVASAGEWKRPQNPESFAAATTSSSRFDQDHQFEDEQESGLVAGDLSEGEYEGSEMDLSDDPTAEPNTTASSLPHDQELPRAPPLMPEIPAQSASGVPGFSTASTPGPQTPGSQARSEQIDNTGLAMARLKAEIQRKQREKRERELLAAKASPNVTASAPGTALQPNGVPVQQTGIQNPLNPRAQIFSVDVAPAKTDIARESKKRRRQEIESGIPSLDAEMANNALRMAELTKQMEQLAANNKKMKEDKERLIRELESIGIDTEGMPHAELQAKKDEIEREREAMSEDGMEEFASPATPSGQLVEEVNDTVARAVTPVPQTGIPGLGAAVVQQSVSASPAAVMQGASPDEATPKLPTEATTTTVDLSQPAQNIAIVEPAHGYGKETTGHQRNMTAGDDEEDDFYSPAPPDDLSAGVDTMVSVNPHHHAHTPSEEGEVAMSESEEEYEPEEPAPTASNVKVPDAAIESSSASSLTSSDDDEEGYEPPETDQPMLDLRPAQATVSNGALTQQGEADDGAMDISSSSDESDESESPSPSAAELASPKPAAFKAGAEEYITIADDLAPELQGAPGAEPGVEDSTVVVEEELDPTRFVPYESPLRQFKSYRYHPNYAQEVPSGFLSMTYSHQIDPDQPICPTEAEGSACTDPSCLFQHFQGMNITGEKLLVQLGTANPGKTPEDRSRWTEGLRGVLKNLRQRSAKDPHDIAMEIAKYRRQFLNDDSRVVNL